MSLPFHLWCLRLNYNEIDKVVFPKGYLYNFTNLEELWLDDSSLHISLLHSIAAVTSLQTWSMGSCQVNTCTCCIPALFDANGDKLTEFLYNQRDYLSHNISTGEFANWLLENNTKLEYLDLTNNSLERSFQLPIHPHLNLNVLYIANNLFHGLIPKEIGGHLPSLTDLYLSRNDFDGSNPSSIGYMNSLVGLDLSYNQLSSKIPKHLIELQLDGNNFTGNMPNSLSKASNLEGLYLSANNLSGRIPSWLGNMSNLKDIVMPNNYLEGPIPLEFCQLKNLKVLDLEANNISGSLSSFFWANNCFCTL
ncbi:hypothetical protein ACOSQ2_032256 [Xanthoceras sorbifolium]